MRYVSSYTLKKTEDHSRPPLLADDGILVLPKNRGFSPRHPLPNLHSEKGNKKHQHYLEELDVKPSRPREILAPPAHTLSIAITTEPYVHSD